MTHDPYRVEPRKPLTSKQRLEMFVAHDGKCCLCGGRIDGVREAWIDEHVAPLWRDGDNAMSNRAPAHVKCARAKTSAEASDRAKGRGAAERHFGAKQSPRPMPFGRRSRYKKKIDGTIIER